MTSRSRRAKPRIVVLGAAPEEAAAVVAALERFLRDTAPQAAPPAAPARSPWALAALREATGHAPGETPAWGKHKT